MAAGRWVRAAGQQAFSSGVLHVVQNMYTDVSYIGGRISKAFSADMHQ